VKGDYGMEGYYVQPFHYSAGHRFRELLLEFSAHEEHSETLLEVLDPMITKPSFSAESLSKHPTIGLAASQLSLWVQGVVRLHSTLQTKIRPLQLKVASMSASLKEYSDKLKKEEHKVGTLHTDYSTVYTAKRICSLFCRSNSFLCCIFLSA
jgi:hypothetical protein